MINHDEVYRKLRREIDKMPVPFSETASGVELKLLKHLFTPAEAEIARHLNILPEAINRIHKRVRKSGFDISPEELEETLDRLVQKGAITGSYFLEAKGKQYSLAQLAIGMFEFQIDRLTPEYARDFEQYVQEQFHKDIHGSKTQQMRTIPVSQSVTPDMRIAPYNDMKRYIAGLKDDIAVSNCVCRQSTDVTGGTCRHSEIRETCLTFSNAARYTIGRNIGRPITNDEALSILDRAEEAGFILQPQNSREPQFLCCCCIDCCHALKILKMHPKPAELLISNYCATIDPSKCTGCRKCIDRCAMDAISMKDRKAVVDRDRCIGCGVCFAVCPNNAHSLHLKEKTYVPPKNQNVLYQKIIVERQGILNTVKTVSRILIGKKA